MMWKPWSITIRAPTGDESPSHFDFSHVASDNNSRPYGGRKLDENDLLEDETITIRAPTGDESAYLMNLPEEELNNNSRPYGGRKEVNRN